ncbi:hypothetical protein [Actinosynnema mirum]|uniref:hypothetical protein n=1 Tax=Actinosynnema mirum TaxID=40567 RepID=UPI00019AB574|nr:hypothetical protein [Actinosynnema mirum]
MDLLSDLADILGLHGCHHCGNSLEGSVSNSFCGESCQRAWAARRNAFGAALGKINAERVRAVGLGQILAGEVFIAPAGTSLDVVGWEPFGTITTPPVESSDWFPALAADAVRANALEARRTRNTGPAGSARQRRAPRAISPRRHRHG